VWLGVVEVEVEVEAKAEAEAEAEEAEVNVVYGYVWWRVVNADGWFVDWLANDSTSPCLTPVPVRSGRG
jgi:hypothetical protein